MCHLRYHGRIWLSGVANEIEHRSGSTQTTKFAFPITTGILDSGLVLNIPRAFFTHFTALSRASHQRCAAPRAPHDVLFVAPMLIGC